MTQYKQDSKQSQVNSFTLSDSAKRALEGASRIAVLTGAGISAESGLGTFRGKEGIWNKMRPEELASMEGFMANPELVWEWYSYRRSLLSTAKPNPAHVALAEWGESCSQFTLVTQNVDGLHQLSGQSEVLELHGNIRVDRCLTCGNESEDDLHEQFEGIPFCSCGGKLRPGVVWFGEMLPERTLMRAFAAAESCDLFLVIGTSAVVYPAAALPEVAADHGAATIEVNLEPTQFSARATCTILSQASIAVPALLTFWKTANSSLTHKELRIS